MSAVAYSARKSKRQFRLFETPTTRCASRLDDVAGGTSPCSQPTVVGRAPTALHGEPGADGAERWGPRRNADEPAQGGPSPAHGPPRGRWTSLPRATEPDRSPPMASRCCRVLGVPPYLGVRKA